MSSTLSKITGEEGLSGLSPQLQAVIHFYRGFNHRDMQAVSSNWLHSREASMANPLGGIKRGWDEIQSVYQSIFNGEAQVYVEFFDYTLSGNDGLFVIAGRERGRLQSGDITLDLAIRTSRVFTLQQGAWRQIHHHGSMDDPALLSRYQTTLLHKKA